MFSKSLTFTRQYTVVVLAVALMALAMSLYPTTASAYPGPDDQCPYGWNTDTNTCQPAPSTTSDPGGGNMDAACQATARFDYCQSSVYIGCNAQGFQTACGLLELSYSDPNTFQQIMTAQKACGLDGDQQACLYLNQFKGTYY